MVSYPERTLGVVAAEIRNSLGEREGFTSGPIEEPTLYTIAHTKFDSEIKVGKYGVSLETLDQVARLVKYLRERAILERKALIFDEVGLMQSFAESLRGEIEEIYVSGVPAILSIKRESPNDWLKMMRGLHGTRTLEVTELNREAVLEEMVKYILANT